MGVIAEKGGGTVQGIKLLLGESPLPPIEAAIAALQREDEIRTRGVQLHAWILELATQLRALGVRTYPTATYLFLADVSPHDAATLAEQLEENDILIKPLNDRRLGPGYLRVTTGLPTDNARFVSVLRRLL